MSGRCDRVKPILLKPLKQTKRTNIPNGCVIEEICLPQNPLIQIYILENFFLIVKFCYVEALRSAL